VLRSQRKATPPIHDGMFGLPEATLQSPSRVRTASAPLKRMQSFSSLTKAASAPLRRVALNHGLQRLLHRRATGQTPWRAIAQLCGVLRQHHATLDACVGQAVPHAEAGAPAAALALLSGRGLQLGLVSHRRRSGRPPGLHVGAAAPRRHA
jgi:hypothetical protein